MLRNNDRETESALEKSTYYNVFVMKSEVLLFYNMKHIF
jgi:hypothetical protein